MVQMIWVCRSCVWACLGIETWAAARGRGDRYLCKTCAITGWMLDPDAPIQITEEEADLYAVQFQTDPTFLPPRLAA